MAVCTGCSLLCDDIELTFKEGKISQSKNLCRKGHGHFQSLYTERISPRIDGQNVSLDQAIKKASEILKQAKHPLLHGWSTSALDAQSTGIDLAKKLGAIINSCASLCQGLVLERIFSGKLPTCYLDDVRNFADASVFWGSDPSNSHPRLLSRFAYYPRGSKRQKSYDEERSCLVVDVRKSATTKLCSNYLRVPPGGDAEFISAIMAVMDGKIPKVGDKKRMIELGTFLRKAEFGIIFPGEAMISSLHDKMELLESFMARLNEVSTFKAIPMIEHFNTRGFCQFLHEETGFINGVSFQGGQPAHGPENCVAAAAKSCDAGLIVGSDPLSSQPLGTARSLSKISLIAIDPHRSLTTDAARVVIPSAISGLEAGGSAMRMDGILIEFEPVVESDLPSDQQILSRIKEEI
jgi:formylmethanofuran dehydrogenase subunit B